MKKHLSFTLFALICIAFSATSLVCMDALDDNPAFLNSFFAERQEFLQQQESKPEQPLVELAAPVAPSQKNNFDRWCDCKPALSQSGTTTESFSEGAKQIFKFYVLSIVLATFCHHLTA